MIPFQLLHPRATYAMLGLIPEFLSESSPAKAVEQLDQAYRHGGGWRPMRGFTLQPNDNLYYPGDPPLAPLAQAMLRFERIVIYPHAWVAVIQPDRSFEVARMD